MPPLWLLVPILVGFLQDPVADEWETLRIRIQTRLASLATRDEPPRPEDLQSEFETLEKLLSRARDPETIAEARFFKASLLEDTLHAPTAALSEYDLLIAVKGLHGLSADLAFARKGALLFKLGREDDLATFITLYAARQDHSPGVVAALEAQLRHLRLRPGRPFPVFESAARLDASPARVPDVQARITVVLFFDSLTTEERPRNAGLDTLVLLDRLLRTHGRSGLSLVPVSVDTRPAIVRRALERREISTPIFHDGKGYKGELAETCGLFAVPTAYVLDGKGVIRAVDVFGTELANRVRAMLLEDRDSPSDGYLPAPTP